MNWERYNYYTNNYQAYEFFSEGPKGRIRKLVVFTKIPDTDPSIYNLAIGEAHPVTGKIDDEIISNNRDRDIVLATLANTIASFYGYI
ncbi:DUF6934 family protein [Mucilaginibacter paludis]|uniref:Uncharacterized protein n=1 Tax=Mucilaginibacter paludis DSM 18603 TaxID=714943 RepID=H1Y466_9SPHI|nr:hypothetical protein [Mucilaginibacter paludis]EHQ24802.1 hypothetical protein Mucpa_0613 [Mucilaginibacter paludis DSM 18603]